MEKLTINKGLGKENELDYRGIAKKVGALFILATAITMVAIVMMGSAFTAPIDLGSIASGEATLIVSIICWLVLAVSVLGIGVYMYPVLKKQNEALAQGYVTLRLLETVFIMISALGMMVLITMSQDWQSTGADAASYSVVNTLMVAIIDWSFIFGTMILLGLGGIPLYYLMYQSEMVPRWLAGLGLMGAVLILIYGIASLFGQNPAFLAAPIAVQEMVFAIWLIAKGFAVPESKVEFQNVVLAPEAARV